MGALSGCYVLTSWHHYGSRQKEHLLGHIKLNDNPAMTVLSWNVAVCEGRRGPAADFLSDRYLFRCAFGY
jgi:hypothetical protein